MPAQETGILQGQPPDWDLLIDSHGLAGQLFSHSTHALLFFIAGTFDTLKVNKVLVGVRVCSAQASKQTRYLRMLKRNQLNNLAHISSKHVILVVLTVDVQSAAQSS